MKTDSIAKRRSDRTWMTAESCKLDDFVKIISRETSLSDYPLASAVQSNVLVYEGDAVRAAATDPDHRKAIMAEWAEAIYSGPGILVFKNAFPDKAVLDAATDTFNAMIREQHEAKTGGGDHFAKPGANDRIWNALEKLCLRDPELFAKYYSNEIVALISESWLGTSYQITSQLNVVNPGGEAQSVHRDYHMGFQTAAEIERFPLHAHQLSPVLTLQGAVAHCDMPVESGPTLICPTRRISCRASLPGASPSSRTTSTRTISSCRWPRAMRCSSAPPFSMPRAITAQGCQAHGEPAAGVLGLWPRHGKHGPRRHVSHSLPHAPQNEIERREISNAIAACAKATPSPPTSTATRPSAASPPNPATAHGKGTRGELGDGRLHRSTQETFLAPADLI